MQRPWVGWLVQGHKDKLGWLVGWGSKGNRDNPWHFSALDILVPSKVDARSLLLFCSRGSFFFQSLCPNWRLLLTFSGSCAKIKVFSLLLPVVGWRITWILLIKNAITLFGDCSKQMINCHVTAVLLIYGLYVYIVVIIILWECVTIFTK